MRFEMHVSPDRAYIEIRIEGDVTREGILAPNLAAHELGRREGIDQFLMDLTASRNVETPFENYRFVHHDRPQAGLDPNARVALLVAPGDHSHDFIETLSRNAGVDVRIFRDRASALAHLASR